MKRVAAAMTTATALALSAFGQDGRSERKTFPSGGRPISVDIYAGGGNSGPAIIVLHGAGGMDAGNKYVAQLASAVAARGYTTFLVEYFNRTETRYASDAIIHAHFGDWLETIRDAVTFASRQPGIDPKRIGTFGYSLGGYLAVAHAAKDDRIQAVVELAGGIDADFAKAVTRLPPTLIIHGKEDTRVPFERGPELERFLAKLGSPVETEYLPNERHILSPLAALKALDRALRFFDVRLR